MTKPELSIIIPFLNERCQLPEFIQTLQGQQGIKLELIFCDGGSSDGGLDWLQRQDLHWAKVKLLQGPPGRGRQLNQGISAAKADWLLLLHVDSRYDDPAALKQSLDYLQRLGSHSVAGHFSLRFRRQHQGPDFGYYFYEWKARLGRPETIHGDQGFLAHRDLLRQVGPFREDLQVMEDTDFAERLRTVGQWQLLPAELSTSARRFEVEGLWQRQLLGSLIMCFRTIGWNVFFPRAPEVYRHQDKAEKLRLRPFFKLIRQLFAELPWRERWQIWHASGGYVRQHAWQILFALDARRAFVQGVPVGCGEMPLTRTLEPVYEFLTDNRLGRLLATVLLRLWFELTDLWLKSRERESR